MGVILKAWAEHDAEQETLSPVTLLGGVFTEPDHNAGKSLSPCWHEDVVYHGMGADGVDRDFHCREAMLGLLLRVQDMPSADHRAFFQAQHAAARS
jgi:hypothetical protein